MNYFPFHVGDYASHTAHLEPMEDLAYRRLLDLYYLREGALPCDIEVTAKLIRMRSMASDVASVLSEFFVLTDEGWIHKRCDVEIEAMREKQQKQRDRANKRWHKPEQEHGNAIRGNATASKNHATAYATASKNDANAMPPTPTPTPINISAPPDGVSQTIWRDFLKTRKTKVTQTAIEGIRREADRAGISLETALETSCARGWQSFKAEWLKTDSIAKPSAFAGAI